VGCAVGTHLSTCGMRIAGVGGERVSLAWAGGPDWRQGRKGGNGPGEGMCVP